MYLEECDVEEQCSLLGWAALQKTKLGWMQIFGVKDFGKFGLKACFGGWGFGEKY